MPQAGPLEPQHTRALPDLLGGLLSGLCVVHCLTMVLLPALLPALGLAVLVDGRAEWGLVVMAVFIAGFAAVRGHRLHRSWRLTAAFLTGMLLLALGRLGEAFSLFPGATLLGISGGCVAVGAHLTSLRRCRACPPGAPS